MTTEITKILEGFKHFSENPYEDSINFLKEYIEVEPSSKAFFELGKALFLNGEYEESVKTLEKSNDSRSNAYLGLDHYMMNNYPNAITHFREFLKNNRNETILSYLMLSHEKNSDWREAILCGEELLEINPKNDSIKLHLIDYHCNLKEYETSLIYLNDLNSKKLNYRKGLILFKLKRFEESIDVLKTIKTVEAYELMSKSYEKVNKPQKAIISLMKAYELDPKTEILLEVSEISFRNGYQKHAIQILEDILRDDPKNERALEKIAEIYLELQKFELVLIYCEDLLEVNEENLKAYLLLSETYLFLSDHEKAMRYVERGLDVHPKSADLWIQKAWIHYGEDIDEFKRAFEKALKLEPNNIKNHIRLIEECIWEDDLDYARRYYDRLLFYNPAFSQSFEEIRERNLW